MVKQNSVAWQAQILEQLAQSLGQPLSKSEWATLLQHIHILEPKPGKQFWHSLDAPAGIYLVLEGKVRLLDRANNLLVSLGTGASLGELTLFPDSSFQPYTARASMQVRLCFVPIVALRSLLDRYSTMRSRLYQAAVQRDSLILAKLSEVSSEQRIDSEGNRKHPILRHSSSLIPCSVSTAASETESKISKAFFPSPIQRFGHWWQRATRRYPFFAQQSAADCGAACLVMIGRYWGKRFSVNRLRDISNVDRNGASLKSLAAAAESIGFSTRPVKAGLSKLAEQSLPAIVHWEGRHYIVVYEIAKKHVVVGDPAIGQRTLTPAQFKAGWTGYTLLLQPTAFLKETPETNQSLWQFIELVKPHWLVLLEVLIASIVIQIFGLVTPMFTQLLLDRVVVQRSSTTLTAVGIGLLIFGLFRVAMSGLRQYLLSHVANRIDTALIVGFIKHTFRLPLGFFESRYVGDIVSRVQENHKIQRFLTGDSLSIFLDFLTVFVYVGLMFWYSWKMALLSLTIVPPFIFLALIATPLLKQISREIFNANTSQGK